jgi:hypothetical protein
LTAEPHSVPPNLVDQLHRTKAIESWQKLKVRRLQRSSTGASCAYPRNLPPPVIGELELNGYAIERVYEHGRLIGVRLLETNASDPPSRRRQRWRRRSR